MTEQRMCPCGGGTYDNCCEPFHAGPTEAPTAEALMRSRYSAFALGLDDYLWRTWHPRTRPEQVTLDDTAWTGLEILDVVDGTERDQSGIVEFVAHYGFGSRAGRMRERSRFGRRGRRWMYVDGENT
ncbi:MAG: YchJ family protein [Propionibacteriaceae bacterium]